MLSLSTCVNQRSAIYICMDTNASTFSITSSLSQTYIPIYRFDRCVQPLKEYWQHLDSFVTIPIISSPQKSARQDFCIAQFVPSQLRSDPTSKMIRSRLSRFTLMIDGLNCTFKLLSSPSCAWSCRRWLIVSSLCTTFWDGGLPLCYSDGRCLGKVDRPDEVEDLDKVFSFIRKHDAQSVQLVVKHVFLLSSTFSWRSKIGPLYLRKEASSVNRKRSGSWKRTSMKVLVSHLRWSF